MSKTDVPNTGIKDVQDWTSNIFKQQGNTAHNPILGDIGLTLKSVKDSIAHGKSQFKFAVFPAIKTVLEQGVLIDTRQIDGVGHHYISAPVDVDGQVDIATVLVKTDPNSQRMYIHSVTSKERLMTLKNQEAQTENSAQVKASSAYIHNILHKALTYKGSSDIGLNQEQVSQVQNQTTNKLSLTGLVKSVKTKLQDADKQHQIMFDYLLDSAKKFNPHLGFIMRASDGFGEYNPTTNNIVIDKVKFDKLSDNQKLALINHELWHSLTEHNLTKPSKAKENLEKMRVQLNSVLTTISDNELVLTYPDGELSNIKNKLLLALENVPEMVAYGMTDPDVQKFIGIYLDLNKAKVTGVKRLKTILDNFFGAVYSLLGLQKKLSFKTFVANADSLVHEIDFNQIGETRQSTHSLVDRIKQVKNVLVDKVPFELNPKSALAWAKEHIRGEYTVQDTGEVISVTNIGLKKTTSHTRHRREHIKSIVAIPELLENAVFLTEKQAEKNNAQFERYRYYLAGLSIDGVDYTARLTIGVDSHGNKFYDHSLTQIEKTKLIDLIEQSASGFKTMGDEPLHLSAKIDDNKLVNIIQEALTKSLPQTRYNKQTVHDKAVHTVNQTPTLTLLKNLDSTGLSQEHNVHLDGLIDGLLASYYVYHSPSQRVDVSQGKLKNKAD